MDPVLLCDPSLYDTVREGVITEFVNEFDQDAETLFDFVSDTVFEPV